MLNKYTINATAGLHVHVGGGDEHKLDPLGYVVKESEGKHWFYRIDVGAMMAHDNSFANTFVKYTEQQNSVGRLRALILEAFNPDKRDTWVHRAAVLNSFYLTYKSKVTDVQLNNQLLVQCMPMSAGKVYLPGSSIKGAIRTAILDRLAEKNKYDTVTANVEKIIAEKRNARFNEEVEKYLLDYHQMQDDPFKALKISDVYLPPDSTVIVEVKNVPLKGEPLSLDMFVEAIKPGTEFQVSIKIEDEAGLNNRNIGKYFLTVDKLLNTCRVFYYNALHEEMDKFYDEDSNAYNCVADVLNAINDEEGNFIPGMSLLRIGRYSHLESMSFNDRGDGKLCQPSPPKDPKTREPKPWGTTRNLVDGKYPLGALILNPEEKRGK
jgi:CRISPR-associated protein Csm5